MSRIRTVKPDFFRHELLQDLEEKHGKLKPMLVFEGLWTISDKNGVFEWRPRQIKLDILPFVTFDMEQALTLLEEHRFVIRYEINGKHYGIIPTFKDHQRITGTELKASGKFPIPDEETLKKHQGNALETPKKHVGRLEKEKEKEKEKERIFKRAAVEDDRPLELPTKEEIAEESIPKLEQDIQTVCDKLYQEKKFKEVYAFKNAAVKLQKNLRSILHTLSRCYLSDPKDPWAYCAKILQMENMNYNARDHQKTT